MDPQKIEDKLDRVTAGATVIDMALGGVKFQSMIELMEFAKLMSLSGLAVPYHLRNNPGACLAVCTKALRFGFDPFSLAEHSSAMKKSMKGPNGWEDVETIAYDSYVIRAIINAHAPIEGQIEYVFDGEGEARTCSAKVKTKDGQYIVWKSAPIGEKLAAMSRNDKGQIKGSPLWEGPKQDVQFAYDTGRDLCRVHFPEVLMGWYDKEEFEARVGPEKAKDVTPRPRIIDRLKGNKGEGFNAGHVKTEADQLAATTDEPVPIIEGEKVEAVAA